MRIVTALLVVASFLVTAALFSQPPVPGRPAGERDEKKPDGEPRAMIPGLHKATDNLAALANSPENLPAYFRASVELRGQLADFRDTLSKRAGLVEQLGLTTGKAVIKKGRQGAEPRDKAPTAQDPPQGSDHPPLTPEEKLKLQRRNDWVTFDPLARQAERQLMALDSAMATKVPSAEAVKQALAKLQTAMKVLENAATPPGGKPKGEAPTE